MPMLRPPVSPRDDIMCIHCSQGGLSRKYFEPFIDVVESTMAVQRVGAGLDYRSSAGAAQPADGPAAMAATTGALIDPAVGDTLEAAWRSLGVVHHQAARDRVGPLILSPAAASQQGAAASGHAIFRSAWDAAIGPHREAQSYRLPVSYGRSLLLQSAMTLDPPPAAGNQEVVPGTSSRADRAVDLPPMRMMAFFTFGQLCGVEGLRDPGSPVGSVLGPSDYLALCRQVAGGSHVVFISCCRCCNTWTSGGNGLALSPAGCEDERQAGPLAGPASPLGPAHVQLI